MPKKLRTGSPAGNVVRRAAAEIPAATPADLARLRATMDGPIDTSDIPERKAPLPRVTRDAAARLPKRRESPIRSAILAELERRPMTRYQLWREARGRCPTLSQSAVYEYLRGQREIGLQYAEALMESVGLGVVRLPRRRRKVGAAD